MSKAIINDKIIVRDYFNTTGFERWQRIYGDGKVNKVQRDIRVGHQQTVDKVLTWLETDGNLTGLSVCDAGCGVGSLSIPLAAAGAMVYGSDISAKMVEEAQQRAQKLLKYRNQPTFITQDLSTLSGKFHTVVCLDVLIHYPTEEAAEMIAHLASLADQRLILSFAPKTLGLTLLKKIGELFPGPSKTTRAYQHKEVEIQQMLTENGFRVARNDMTSTRFYYSRLLEAVRI